MMDLITFTKISMPSVLFIIASIVAKEERTMNTRRLFDLVKANSPANGTIGILQEGDHAQNVFIGTQSILLF